MARIDISRLRKENGMSQSELAHRLQITQSFLSAIENGKSPLPIEKEEKLKDIFPASDIRDYIIDRKEDDDRKITEMTDSDLFNQLLNRFHRQAHSAEGEHHHHDHHEKIATLEEKVNLMAARLEKLLERNDALMIRNDRLAEDNDRLRTMNDDLRSEIDRLRSEIFRLKS